MSGCVLSVTNTNGALLSISRKERLMRSIHDLFHPFSRMQ